MVNKTTLSDIEQALSSSIAALRKMQDYERKLTNAELGTLVKNVELLADYMSILTRIISECDDRITTLEQKS